MPKPRYRKSAMAGILVVDKPVGWSSMDVVRRVRSAAGWVKTGHAGSLDPLATGVVVCCVGAATRYVEKIMGMPKVYATQIDLSAFTETDDAEGARQDVDVSEPPDEEMVRRVLPDFIGDIQQVPPRYSAVHVKGQRAYKMARRGQEVELEARTVHVESIDLLAYQFPRLALEIRCGRGTYVRSMARDLGRALGTGGFLAGLRRTAVGPYDLARAVDEKRLETPITQADLLAPPMDG